jgi:hypothetical protein
VFALFVVVRLQRATKGAQTVHAEEAPGFVDHGLLLAASATARFVAEHLDCMVVSAPDASPRRPTPDVSNCTDIDRARESLRVDHDEPQ